MHRGTGLVWDQAPPVPGVWLLPPGDLGRLDSPRWHKSLSPPYTHGLLPLLFKMLQFRQQRWHYTTSKARLQKAMYLPPEKVGPLPCIKRDNLRPPCLRKPRPHGVTINNTEELQKDSPTRGPRPQPPGTWVKTLQVTPGSPCGVTLSRWVSQVWPQTSWDR